MLPHNPVNPTSKQYTPSLTLRGRMEPTPPPDVLAKTKYIYRSQGGSEGRIVMWVTEAHKSGITTTCTGWMVRYPLATEATVASTSGIQANGIPPANGSNVSVGGPHAAPPLMPPIVEGMVTEPCEGRWLEPYSGAGP
jgi:hypothetical protein